MRVFNPLTSLGRLDFRQPHPWANLTSILIVSALCAVLAWVLHGAMQVRRVDAEVAGMNQRIEQRQSELKALARKAARQSPGDQTRQQMLARQAATSLPVLKHIESAWEPRIALLSLTVRRAGREAQLDGVARELDQIHAFMTRLDQANGAGAAGSGARVALQRISHRAEGADRVLQFTLHIEMP